MPSRPSSAAPAFVPAIDGLRGVAALAVLLFHCWVFSDAPLGGGALRALAASGGLGVDFFFVISGFVLFLPVARSDGRFGDVRAYAVRRVARIVPAYWASVVACVLLVPPLTGFPSPLASPGGWLVTIAHLLFLQHELPASLARAAGYAGNVVGFGVNGVVWSLSIEVLFYAALPLVASPFFRRPVIGVALAVAVSVGWRALALFLTPPAGPTPPRLLEQFPAFCAHFAFGMAAALIYVRAWRDEPRARTSRLTVAVAQLAALALLVAVMLDHGATMARSPGLGFARTSGTLAPPLAFAALLLLAATRPEGPLRVLARPRARWLGDVSYGVFLWHMPLIVALQPLTASIGLRSDAAFVALCALVVPASLVLGWASRRFLEEPAIAWAHRA